MKKIKIIIDGSNVAFAIRDAKKKPKVHNLELIIDFLIKLSENFPIEFSIIIDASLRHRIDLKSKLEELERVGKVIQTPCNHTADEFIIEYARRHPEETIIISNDRFPEFNTENLSQCNFMIVFDEIIIKPSLKHIFELKSNQITQARQINVCKI